MKNESDLMEKYDVPAPRYTSYPTVPYWETDPTTAQWLNALNLAFESKETSWAMYIHIPYCETLCTFCGCNTSITKDHKKEEPYKNLLLKEFELYLEKVPLLETRALSELHLGGGTPTFFSASNLKSLLEPIFKKTNSKNVQASIEVDPRRTTRDQLSTLRNLGFNRVSMGVQDFNPEVQRLVNRIQPHDVTAQLTQDARDLGFSSVNYDLIYGLPKQTPESIRDTVKKTVLLLPDRIAFYSYAHVPWIKPAQRLFTEADLPSGAEKRKLYEIGREILTSAGYVEIGMDHFALKTDSLFLSDQNGSLHRNFMGYTSQRTQVLLGLGVSAISEAPTCFHQNEKVLPVYERRLSLDEIPTFRGHLLTEEDRRAREQILQLMTQWKTTLDENQTDEVSKVLKPMIDDGLVTIDRLNLKINEAGRPFFKKRLHGP